MKHLWIAGLLILVATNSSASRPERLSCQAAPRAYPAAPATRNDTLRGVQAVHDCVAQTVEAKLRPMPQTLAFWPRLLDLAIIAILVSGLIWAARGRPISSRWAGGAILGVLILFGGRYWLNSTLTAHSESARERRLNGAEARWQLDMLRARQTPSDAVAADLAIKATERFITVALQTLD